MELFNLPQFIQAGMKAEPFTYTSRLEPSRDQMKPWNGPSQFYLNNSINELVHTQPPVSHIKDVFRCFGNLTVAIVLFLLIISLSIRYDLDQNSRSIITRI